VVFLLHVKVGPVAERPNVRLMKTSEEGDCNALTRHMGECYSVREKSRILYYNALRF
jgi:hypothetical protein